MDNFDEIVQRIKDANPIEDVIMDCGHKFQKEGGKYWRVPHAGGLVVNVVKQRFFWATRGWNGDVVEFVMKDKGWEFRTVVEWLADRAGLERPNWGKTDEAAMKAYRLKLSVFEIAQQLFQEWLWNDKEALDYLLGRGFTEETIKAAGMGFTGRRSAEQFTQMKGQFDLYGIAHDCPQAVTVLGYVGDISAWCGKWNIDITSKDWDKSWVEKGRLHGLMIRPGIVYAHQWGGRVNYLTRRNLPGFDEIKSWNPQLMFAGTRQPYFNSVYRPDALECVIVEGPADAETFGMWGIASVALCGVSAEDDGMMSLQTRLKKHKRLYLALDNDKAGNKMREKVAMVFGPMIYLVDWSMKFTANEDVNNDEE